MVSAAARELVRQRLRQADGLLELREDLPVERLHLDALVVRLPYRLDAHAQRRLLLLLRQQAHAGDALDYRLHGAGGRPGHAKDVRGGADGVDLVCRLTVRAELLGEDRQHFAGAGGRLDHRLDYRLLARCQRDHKAGEEHYRAAGQRRQHLRYLEWLFARLLWCLAAPRLAVVIHGKPSRTVSSQRDGCSLGRDAGPLPRPLAGRCGGSPRDKRPGRRRRRPSRAGRPTG